MKTQLVPISSVKLNPANPRIIKDEKFAKLVKSIKEFPQMLQIRPIVVNGDMVVLGGNMRLRAAKQAGLQEIPIIRADELTPEQQAEFIIKDNVGFGEWSWDTLANEWDHLKLEEWGLDVPVFKEIDAQDVAEEDKSDVDPHITVTFKDPEIMQKAEIAIAEAVHGRFADALITINLGRFAQ